jgi:hypothetical protein
MVDLVFACTYTTQEGYVVTMCVDKKRYTERMQTIRPAQPARAGGIGRNKQESLLSSTCPDPVKELCEIATRLVGRGLRQWLIHQMGRAERKVCG